MKFNYGIFKSAVYYIYNHIFIIEKNPNVRTYKKTNLTEKDIVIGDYTYGAKTLSIYNWKEMDKVRIGKFCSIAEEVKILVDGYHRSDWITTFPFEYMLEGFPPVEGTSRMEGRDIVIGNDVWIGMDVLILPRGRYASTGWVPGNLLTEGTIIVG